MKDWQKYLLALAVVVAIFAIPFVINPSAGFGGADVAGSNAIISQQPGYERWVLPLWQPPPETESMLFALQAAIGGAIVGYFVGHEKARKENEEKKNEKKTAGRD